MLYDLASSPNILFGVNMQFQSRVKNIEARQMS